MGALLGLVTCGFLLITANSLSAQQPPSPEPGTRVRVTAPSMGLVRYVGTLASTDNDTLVVGTTPIPATAMTRLEVHQGVGSNARRGAVIGGSITGAIGFVFTIGWIASDCGGWGCNPGAGKYVLGPLVSTVIFALPGAGIGALIGASSTHDKWVAVPTAHPEMSLMPNGFAFGLSARL